MSGGFTGFVSKLGNTAKGVLEPMTGNIEKAVISVTDCSSLASAGIMGEAVTVSGASKSVFGTDLGSMSTSVGAMIQNSTGALDGLTAAVPNLSDATKNALSAVQKKNFTVQFNPSELTLSGYGGGRIAKTNFAAQEQKLSFGKMDVRITLNVKLIFDQVDPQSAFLADRINTSYSTIGTGIAKAVAKGLSKTVQKTVQTQVEGFIGALRSPYTRQITFSWGTMSYSGVLNRVASQYTMFNTTGEPVRATVDLSLVCVDSSVDAGNMGHWGEVYERAFSGKNKSLVKLGQKVENLIDL